MFEVFNRVGPTGDTELDRRASDKTHVEFALGLMDGPYNSLEVCPGQHKVLVRRNLAGKVAWLQSFGRDTCPHGVGHGSTRGSDHSGQSRGCRGESPPLRGQHCYLPSGGGDSSELHQQWVHPVTLCRVFFQITRRTSLFITGIEILLKFLAVLLRQRNTSVLLCHWRAREGPITPDEARRLMAETAHHLKNHIIHCGVIFTGATSAVCS